MKLLKKYSKWVSGLSLAAVGLLVGGVAKADYSTTTIASSFSDTLDGVVQAIIGTVVSFFTNNLPLIVVLGVSISLVLYFVSKAKRAGKGR